MKTTSIEQLRKLSQRVQDKDAKEQEERDIAYLLTLHDSVISAAKRGMPRFIADQRVLQGVNTKLAMKTFQEMFPGCKISNAWTTAKREEVIFIDWDEE